MTIQHQIMILLNNRVLVPCEWIGSIQNHIRFETIQIAQDSKCIELPNLVAKVDFERYAAFTELNSLVSKGWVVLTEYGTQQIECLWI